MTIVIPQPSIAWEEVEQALIDWAQDMSGLVAVWAEENGTQPDRPYVVLDWLVPPTQVGDDYFTDTVDETTQELERALTGVRESVITVRVEAASTRAAENAFYYCDLLSNSLGDSDVVGERFKPLRMAPWGVEKPRTIGASEGDVQRISRAAFDVRLGFAAGTGQASKRVPYITSVSITGTVTNTTPELVEAASITS